MGWGRGPFTILYYNTAAFSRAITWIFPTFASLFAFRDGRRTKKCFQRSVCDNQLKNHWNGLHLKHNVISNRHFLPHLNTCIGSNVDKVVFLCTLHWLVRSNVAICHKSFHGALLQLNLEFRRAPNGAYTQINLKRLNFPLNGIGIDFFAHPPR